MLFLTILLFETIAPEPDEALVFVPLVALYPALKAIVASALDGKLL
jgi:hypothetical protein